LQKEATAESSLLQRVLALEDRFAIYNLLASQPPVIESGEKQLYLDLFAQGGVLDRGELGVTTVNEMAENYEKVGMPEALASGLAHFPGLPYVAVEGETALAISYLLTVMPDPTAEEVGLAAHGRGRGHRIFRLVANRWELKKEDGAWKIARRTLRHHNGSGAARELLHKTLADMRHIENGDGH